MSDQQDDPVLRQTYHEAVKIQDERASEATRLAVLAAAACAVQAGPRVLDVNEEKAASSRITGMSWLSFRQPLAMAATLVFSVGVGLILFEQERAPLPASVPALASASPGPASASKDVARSESEQTKAASVPASVLSNKPPSIPEPAVARAAAAKAEAKPQTVPRSRSGAGLAEAKPVRRSEDREQKSDAQANRDTASEASSAFSRQDLPAAPAIVSSAPMSLRAAPIPAPSPLAGEQWLKASGAPKGSVQRSAADWLAAIIQLRRGGEVDEAERELQAFRRAYPNVEVPLEALP